MKKRSLLFVGALIAAIGVTWGIRWVLTQRVEVIEVPMDGMQAAVDSVLSERELAQADAAIADMELLNQSELTIAHQAVRAALAEWGVDLENVDPLICIRARELEGKLQRWQSQTREPLEDILVQEMAAHSKRLHEWNANHRGIAGDAGAIAASRAVRGDTQALLLLAETIYSQSAVPMCPDDMAINIARYGQVFNEAAARAERREQNLRQLETQQLQRAQEVWARQAESGVEPTVVRRPVEAPQAAPAEAAAPPAESGIDWKGFFYGDGNDE